MKKRLSPKQALSVPVPRGSSCLPGCAGGPAATRCTVSSACPALALASAHARHSSTARGDEASIGGIPKGVARAPGDEQAPSDWYAPSERISQMERRLHDTMQTNLKCPNKSGRFLVNYEAQESLTDNRTTMCHFSPGAFSAAPRPLVCSGPVAWPPPLPAETAVQPLLLQIPSTPTHPLPSSTAHTHPWARVEIEEKRSATLEHHSTTAHQLEQRSSCNAHLCCHFEIALLDEVLLLEAHIEQIPAPLWLHHLFAAQHFKLVLHFLVTEQQPAESKVRPALRVLLMLGADCMKGLKEVNSLAEMDNIPPKRANTFIKRFPVWAR
eukprot:1159611-Pelagomonas_calceolata.AAC.4